MKFLLLLAVIGIAIWMFKSRHRVPGPKKPPPPVKPGGPAAGVTPMLACAHCGVHLPKTDAVLDPAGRAYCSAAHLQAGPR
jgi:uncharacterized protein